LGQGYGGYVDAQANAQFMEHLQDATQLHGFFAPLDFAQKDVAHASTAGRIVQAQTLVLAHRADSDAKLANGVNGNLHEFLKIDSIASIVAKNGMQVKQSMVLHRFSCFMADNHKKRFERIVLCGCREHMGFIDVLASMRALRYPRAPATPPA
jgi:hypothetical protein